MHPFGFELGFRREMLDHLLSGKDQQRGQQGG